MRLTRRRTIGAGAAALAGSALSPFWGTATMAQEANMAGDTLMLAEGELGIHPVSHASVAFDFADQTIYADPVGAPAAYEGLRRPDLILITHEHGDHYSPETLAALTGDETRLIANPAVFGMLPADLQSKTTSMANGDGTAIMGFDIDAIPAYNTTPERLQFHPEGRDNGYILGLGGSRVYVAGDTEDIPEMRALTGITLAFVPMDGRFTMSMQQAAEGVAAFAPDVVYPYHYRGVDTSVFKSLVEQSGVATEVRLHDWYA